MRMCLRERVCFERTFFLLDEVLATFPQQPQLRAVLVGIRLRITTPLYREQGQNIVSYRDRKPQKNAKSWMKPLLQ